MLTARNTPNIKKLGGEFEVEPNSYCQIMVANTKVIEKQHSRNSAVTIRVMAYKYTLFFVTMDTFLNFMVSIFKFLSNKKIKSVTNI